MSRRLPPAVQFLVAAFAAVVALGPGLASIADARPVAPGAVQLLGQHVEESGSQHEGRAHLDDCSLCRLATRGDGARVSAPLPSLGAAPAPLAAVQVTAHRTPGARWTALSRGPPAA